ncbi:MAG: AbrB/MazE/SpoVT family DNA-binding domain-containing protein [Candidatus Woesearchaeota archaeon]
MQRKVIQLAGKTLVVSLPNKWVKQFGIQKGDELDILEEDNQLVIRSGKPKKQEKIVVDLSNLGMMARRTLGASYKAGYNEVEVFFDEPDKLEIINKETLQFIGFEVMEQSNTRCLIKEISSNHELEFENVLRMIFRSINEIGIDTVEALKDHNLKKLENISMRDKVINRYTDFCRRNLNKFGYPDKNKSFVVYHVCEELEKISDCYKDLCKVVYKDDIVVSKKTRDLLQNINETIKLLQMAYYDYKPEVLEKFGQLCESTKEKISKEIFNHIKEAKVYLILFNMICLIFDVNGAIIVKSF